MPERPILKANLQGILVKPITATAYVPQSLQIPNIGLVDASADIGSYAAGQHVIILTVQTTTECIVTAENITMINGNLAALATQISSKYNPYATQTASTTGVASAQSYAQLNTIALSVVGLICSTAVVISLVGATSGKVYFTTTLPITTTAMTPYTESLEPFLALPQTEVINLVITGTITGGNINMKIYGN